MQENTKASPRLMAVAAIALVSAAMAVFAWLSGGEVAGAASTSGSAASGRFAPVQSPGGSAPDAPAAAAQDPDGRDCPEHDDGGGGDQGTGDTGAQPAPQGAGSTTDL